MFVLTSLLLVTCAVAQSTNPASYDFNSNSCLRRSVYVYTSESSTYVVTDFGSASLIATPTFCANASVSTSTVYGTAAIPASTVTVYQQTASTSPSAVSSPTAGTVIADNGFENGNADPFDASSSSSIVTAEVVSSGPMKPYSGDNYL